MAIYSRSSIQNSNNKRFRIWKKKYIIEFNRKPTRHKIYLYAKDLHEAKYQYLNNIREKIGTDHYDDPKAFIEYSNDMQDVYKNIDEHNIEYPNNMQDVYKDIDEYNIEYSNHMQNVYKDIDECNADKKRKILIVFDDMIVNMINNKKLNSIVTELFIRGRNLNISFVFITQSYIKVFKDVRLNTTHFFITKIPSKRELQQIALNLSSDINTKDFINIYKKCTAETYSFLVNDTTLASDNLLRFRKKFFNI